jgi:nucleotide-binding universal stress UspA family protein
MSGSNDDIGFDRREWCLRYHHLLLHARAFGGFLATHDQIGSEMQSIVVGVDGSPASQRATEVGLQLAASLGAHVAFIHFSPLAAKLYQEDPDDGPSQQRLEEADRVLRQAAEAAKAKGVPAELELHESDMIAPELAGAAEGREADFLVVGNRGHSKVADIVLGSVSHELLRMSRVPVVVVHAGTGQN